MKARADSASATGNRILEAAQRLFLESSYAQLSLDLVARAADVTVQTVIRRFVSKEGLMAAAAARLMEEVRTQRDEAPRGDVPGAIANLMLHYETVGRLVIRVLEQEHIPTLHRIAEGGRQLHRRWVKRTFGPLLAREGAEAKRRQLDQLVVATDVYVWKLLRLNFGRSRSEAEATLVDLVERLLTPPPRSGATS